MLPRRAIHTIARPSREAKGGHAFQKRQDTWRAAPFKTAGHLFGCALAQIAKGVAHGGDLIGYGFWPCGLVGGFGKAGGHFRLTALFRHLPGRVLILGALAKEMDETARALKAEILADPDRAGAKLNKAKGRYRFI